VTGFELGAFDTFTTHVIVAGCDTSRKNELCASRRAPGAVGRHDALHHDVTRVDASVPFRR